MDEVPEIKKILSEDEQFDIWSGFITAMIYATTYTRYGAKASKDEFERVTDEYCLFLSNYMKEIEGVRYTFLGINKVNFLYQLHTDKELKEELYSVYIGECANGGVNKLCKEYSECMNIFMENVKKIID